MLLLLRALPRCVVCAEDWMAICCYYYSANVFFFSLLSSNIHRSELSTVLSFPSFLSIVPCTAFDAPSSVCVVLCCRYTNLREDGWNELCYVIHFWCRLHVFVSNVFVCVYACKCTCRFIVIWLTIQCTIFSAIIYGWAHHMKHKYMYIVHRRVFWSSFLVFGWLR